MLFVMRQRVRAAGHSLAGDGMLLRLRNASIALIAAIAAVGLGLTLFIAQLGFPSVFSSPIPGNPTEAGAVHDAVALTHSPAVSTSSPTLRVRSRAGAQEHPRHAGRSVNGKGDNSGGEVGGSRHVAVSPGAPQTPAGQQPVASVPVSTPTTPVTEPTASAPPATPVPPAVESSPKSSSDGQPKGASPGTTKPNAPSSAKATSDSGGSKSTGGKTTKSDGPTASGGKSSNAAAEKAGKDQSAAVAPPPVAPPATTPAPEPVSPAAAKEAADGSRSDGSHH
jgi:hypothetical protein